MTKNGKDYAISTLRLLALLLVIGCHYFEWLGSNLEGQPKIFRIIGNSSSVGVQVFLLISGFLYGRKDLFKESTFRVNFVLKNFWKILKDYYIHYLLVTIPVCMLLESWHLTRDAIWGVITAWRTMGREVQLWFIPYILFCYLITPMLYDIRNWMIEKKQIYLFFVFISLVEILLLSYQSYFIPAWICCYIIGYFLPSFDKFNFKYFKMKYYWILAVPCLVLNIIKLYLKYFLELTLEGLKGVIYTEFINWTRVMLAVTIFSGGYYVIRKYVEIESKNKFLDLADKFSYDIYISHMIFVKGMLTTVFLTSNMMVNFFITMFAIVSSGIILYYICRPKEVFYYWRKRREPRH